MLVKTNGMLLNHINSIVRNSKELERVTGNPRRIKILQDMVHNFHYGHLEIIEKLNKIHQIEAKK